MQHRRGKSSATDMEIRRQRLLEAGFQFFSQYGIEGISMKEIAREAGVGIATLFRYFPSKPDYVLAIGIWKWEQVLQSIDQQLHEAEVMSYTSAQRYEFFLDSFIMMYRSNRGILRFNQFFNIYLQCAGNDPAFFQPYVAMIDSLSDRFATNMANLKSDGTMRQDMSMQRVFSTSLHLMLAAATRFAVGLVYHPESAMKPEEELELLKQMLLATFRNDTDGRKTPPIVAEQ